MEEYINITLYNKDRAKINSNINGLLDNIRDFYIIPNPSSKYSMYAPDTLSCITPLGTFLIGHTNSILEKLEEIYPNTTINIEDKLSELVNPSFKYNFQQPLNKEFIYRDYQEESIKLSLSQGRGVILLPTRAGKSLVMYGIINSAEFKNILIMVPNIQLVKQMNDDFIKYGWPEDKIQMFSGFSPDIDKSKGGIIISNYSYRSWLMNRFKELPEIDCLIVDEVHSIKSSNKISKKLKSIKTPIKFGFTGTLPEDTQDRWNIEGIIGPTIYSKEIKTLQNSEVLNSVKIKPIKFKWKKKPNLIPNNFDSNAERLKFYKKLFREEYKVIEKNDNYNNIILKISKKLSGNTLILFDHVDHGNRLFKMLDYENKCFVDGTINIDDREDIKNKFNDKNDVILIANVKCFGTGITLKEIQNIIFVMSGKALTKVIQAIGRGLQKRKDPLILIDTYHNFKYSQKHFTRRKELYNENYGKQSIKEEKIINI